MYMIHPDSCITLDGNYRPDSKYGGKFVSVDEAVGFIRQFRPQELAYVARVATVERGTTAAIFHQGKVWKPVDPAAPDLLAALEAFVWLHDSTDRRLCEDAGVDPGVDGCDCDLCLKAKTAIAAARGEQ